MDLYFFCPFPSLSSSSPFSLPSPPLFPFPYPSFSPVEVGDTMTFSASTKLMLNPCRIHLSMLIIFLEAWLAVGCDLMCLFWERRSLHQFFREEKEDLWFPSGKQICCPLSSLWMRTVISALLTLLFSTHRKATRHNLLCIGSQDN